MTKLKIDMSKIMSVLFNIFRTLRTKIAHGPILGKKEEGEKKKKSNKIFPKYNMHVIWKRYNKSNVGAKYQIP